MLVGESLKRMGGAKTHAEAEIFMGDSASVGALNPIAVSRPSPKGQVGSLLCVIVV